EKRARAEISAKDQSLVDRRMTLEERCRGRLDGPGDPRAGKGSAHADDERHRANDVADRAEQHDEDLLWAIAPFHPAPPRYRRRSASHSSRALRAGRARAAAAAGRRDRLSPPSAENGADFVFAP